MQLFFLRINFDILAKEVKPLYLHQCKTFSSLKGRTCVHIIRLIGMVLLFPLLSLQLPHADLPRLSPRRPPRSQTLFRLQLDHNVCVSKNGKSASYFCIIILLFHLGISPQLKSSLVNIGLSRAREPSFGKHYVYYYDV